MVLPVFVTPNYDSTKVYFVYFCFFPGEAPDKTKACLLLYRRLRSRASKTLQEVANFPVITSEQAMAPIEPEPEPESAPFDGDIGKFGRVPHDVPLDGNGA
jgi:hypothetical protein